jgi:hypothetical protein
MFFTSLPVLQSSHEYLGKNKKKISRQKNASNFIASCIISHEHTLSKHFCCFAIICPSLTIAQVLNVVPGEVSNVAHFHYTFFL